MITNSFTHGPEGWCSYDYHHSIVSGGHNIFILATWSPEGGVEGSGHIWTDHTRWSADTPEQPLSILPLLFYRRWMGLGPVDLRNARVSVHLRGDNLQLDGARCYFWVHSGHTRWHCTAHPLEITDGRWPEKPCRFTLETDESLWHHSWSLDRANPMRLDALLGRAESYGFSFTGNGRKGPGCAAPAPAAPAGPAPPPQSAATGCTPRCTRPYSAPCSPRPH